MNISRIVMYRIKSQWDSKKHILQWPPGNVRKAFQQRYRQFLWMNEVQRFYADYPCYPILDDHEILDDWGSEPVHTVPEDGLDYGNLRTGALRAYIDYQASRLTLKLIGYTEDDHHTDVEMFESKMI
ncbi:MAG: alkaline phosphatase D family protein [Deltaproteobacteria bacterium]|nr:alkaline phosphatase D family protein [Deltaproteobacteria bacterium]